MNQGQTLERVEQKPVTQVQYANIGDLELESGTVLPNVTIAYETYGRRSEQANNVVLVCHAFSGDSHAAFYYENDDKPGWWDNYIGPGKAIDTEKYFVICSNVIGGCRGSTGPLSINPQTGEIYGAAFPFVTVYDMVNAQNRLLQTLEIPVLYAVIGGSMGGMQALQWTVSFPEKVERAVLLASSAEHSAQQIAFNEVGRQAILSDPKYNNGNYGKDIPKSGLSLARMIGHITYLSEELMKEKFGRQGPKEGWHSADFAVGSYLVYQGEKFVDRFDPNTYILLSKALDHFSLGKGVTLTHNLSGVKSKFLVVAFNSDWLYPPEQSEEIVKSLEILNIPVSYCVLNTKEGHDSFLLPNHQLERIISRFLETNSV